MARFPGTRGFWRLTWAWRRESEKTGTATVNVLDGGEFGGGAGDASSGSRAITLTDVQAWYGESHILQGVTMHVDHGEIVCLLGRNGAGRTTALRAIMGLVSRRTGRIVINDRDAIDLQPHQIARLGVGYCPEERGIMATLTCEENLIFPPKVAAGGMELREIYAMFPNLESRRTSYGGHLSGGEQQMLAVARILCTGARILLLDEISEGLAPVIVQALAQMIRELRSRGFTILMVEQNSRFAVPLADRFYVMARGEIVREFAASELRGDANILQEYLSV